MAVNLRNRLKRIKEQKKAGVSEKNENLPSGNSGLINQGWESSGCMVLKREIAVPSTLKRMKRVPPAIGIVIPDLAGKSLPKPEDFLFFDLETTGLSCGVETIAFLAAFGRFSGDKLLITQYLLLDYSGENDFLDNVLNEFKLKSYVTVTYNGKCFDSRILNARCLLNKKKPPEFNHADLLHPARRLWKSVIHNCSQGSVETRILGLDRSGDTPGFLAPEIWFEFLKTGRIERLQGICDHNVSDISGLASILVAMISIAEDPFDNRYIFDIECLVQN